MMTSYVWHCFSVSALIAWKNTGAYYISALSCHTAPVGQNSVGSKTKSIRPRLRPRPKLQDQDQDRGRSETSLVIRPRSQTPRLFTTRHNRPPRGRLRWHQRSALSACTLLRSGTDPLLLLILFLLFFFLLLGRSKPNAPSFQIISGWNLAGMFFT